MSILLNFTVEELRMIEKERNVGSYENMSKEQLENVFTMLSAIMLDHP